MFYRFKHNQMNNKRWDGKDLFGHIFETYVWSTKQKCLFAIMIIYEFRIISENYWSIFINPHLLLWWCLYLNKISEILLAKPCFSLPHLPFTISKSKLKSSMNMFILIIFWKKSSHIKTGMNFKDSIFRENMIRQKIAVSK